MDFSTSVSIVTGGTSGIGAAVVSSLAQQGGRVAFCGRSIASVTRTVEHLQSAGIEALGLPCDVRDVSEVERFVQRVCEAYGPIDILINNAGLAHFAELTALSIEQIQETFDVNVSGVFHMTRAVLPEMLTRRTGNIVNIASLAGKNGVAGGTAYSASKHAVLGFSRSLMLEVRQQGIRVIAVCPGSVETAFFASAGLEIKNPDRILQPNDVAHTVLSALSLPQRALVSELDVRPASP